MPALERLIFFGTPTFAVPSLEGLVAAGRPPRLVVTRPTRPVGRGGRLTEPPVAERARALGLEVAQPARVRDPQFLDLLRPLAPDLAIVVAFGQIFPRELLALPRLGCVNLHASLLPRWRGAAPIAAAIEAGDAETGVTTQRMEEGLDSGPVLGERRTAILPEETAGELGARLAQLGAELLLETVAALERGTAVERPQDDQAATYAGKLLGPAPLDLERTAAELSRLVRSRSPEPGATVTVAGEPVRVIAAREATGPGGVDAPPGLVLGIAGPALQVAVGGGSVLSLERVQRPGRAVVSGRDFANGARLTAGSAL